MASDRNNNNLPNGPAFPKSFSAVISQTLALHSLFLQLRFCNVYERNNRIRKAKKSRTAKTTANSTRLPIETTATTEHGTQGIPMTLGTSQSLVTNDKNVSIPTSLVPAPAAHTSISDSSLHVKYASAAKSKIWHINTLVQASVEASFSISHLKVSSGVFFHMFIHVNGDVAICTPVFNIGLNQSGHLIIGDHAMSMILCRIVQRQLHGYVIAIFENLVGIGYVLINGQAVEMNSRRIFQQLSIGATVTVSSSVGIAKAQRRSLDPLAELRGPNFGSQGKIVLTSENSNSFNVGVRFDKPILEGQDLGGQCEAGHGFFCNASELQPESTTLKDLQKLISNILLEVRIIKIGPQSGPEGPCKKGMNERDEGEDPCSNNCGMSEQLVNVSNCFPSSLSVHQDMVRHVSLKKFQRAGCLLLNSQAIMHLWYNNLQMLECYCRKQEKEKFLDETHKAVLKRQFADHFEFLRAEENFICLGNLRKPSKGILLFGPPGTGKTMLAKAVATEAGANFINSSMSSIASKWYGDPEKYVRAVFSLASKIASSVIFIDEVDSMFMLGQRRNQEHEATRKMKNEFMVNWDGLACAQKIKKGLMVNLSDAPNRSKILKLILAKEELPPDVVFDAIAGMTDGFSGRDLKKSMCHCCIRSVREILEKERKKKAVMNESSDIRPINMNDFKYAREQC
ncbi:unnamed protein product [Camellia sinensis]